MSLLRMLAVGLVVMLWLAADAPLGAEEFRVETTVFLNDKEEPVDHSVTLFQNRLVYDFRSEGSHVTVFKMSGPDGKGRFVLLDTNRELRTEISTDQILAFMDNLKSWAAEQPDPLLQFAADPKFTESYEENAQDDLGELTLTSDLLTYRLLTAKAKDREHQQIYREYNDWNARLNTMLHAGSTPPFPRLAASRALAQHGVVPRQVILTIPAHKPYRSTDLVIRAEHEIRWRLSKEDRQRIEQVGRDLVAFKPVDDTLRR